MIAFLEKLDADHFWTLTANGPVKRKKETKIHILIARHKLLLDRQTYKMNQADSIEIKREANKQFYTWLKDNIDSNNPSHIVPYSKQLNS